MPDQPRPSFDSKIPDYLLATASPEMAYLLHEASKNSQATEYLLDNQEIDKKDRAEFRVEVKDKLKGLDEKISYTNGRVAATLKDLEEVKRIRDENKSDLDQIVATKRIILKVAGSKIFWISLTVFVFFGVNTGFFSGILKWVFKSLNLV